MSQFTGSTYQRKDGYWVAALTVGGQKIVRYARTEREARQKLTELQREHWAGHLTQPTSLTLNEWVEEWLLQRAADLRPSTLQTYGYALRRLLPHLGKVKLHKLTAAMIAHHLSRLRKEGVGERSIQQSHTYLHTCLQGAVALDLLGRNPLDSIRAPRAQPKERKHLSLEEMRALLDAALHSKLRTAPLIAFLLGTGLRVGEALGLDWRDVDWDQQLVRVQRQRTWVGTTLHLLPPKTKTGVRSVTLPDFCIRLLKAAPPALDPDTPVFTSSTGTIPNPANLRRGLRILCQAAGVPIVSIHQLRHAHASLLIASGADIRSVQARLGHTSPNVTLGIYSHLITSGDAAARVQRALSPNVSQ